MLSYDAVVVGAGNAGLTAAIRLALGGAKTLLIEQHNLPGGCATSFRRGRFEFEPSLHELCDYGTAENPGDLRKLFRELGVEPELLEVPDCYRVISRFRDGSPMDVTMPAGRENYLAKMEEYVPGSRPSMERFLALCDEIVEGTAFVSAAAGHADPAELRRRYPDLLRTGAYPVPRVFQALGLPQKAQDILSIYWAYLGVDLPRMAFVHYASMVHRYITKSACIPKHTSHELSEALLARFRALGGDVFFGVRAREFLFEGRRLSGVRTTAGPIACRAALADLNPNVIYGRMVPKELVPARERKLLGARTISGRMLVAYFGLNKTAEELGIRDYSIFMPCSSDSVAAYRSLGSMEGNDYEIFVCYNIANPDFSPPGTAVVSLTTMYTKDVWGGVAPADYARQKEKIAAKMLAQLKKTAGIDLEGAIEEVSIATPWTFARYLGAPEGAVYGYETADWDSMMARMMMLGQDYPIAGLRPIGAAGPRGDGYSSAYVCGDLLAKLALKDLREGGI